MRRNPADTLITDEPELGAEDRMTEADDGALRGMALMVVVGIVLGVAYNELGRRSRHPWGLDWIAVDRVQQLAEMETVTASPPSAAPRGSSLYSGSDDPLAMPATAAVESALPEIPAVGRPVQIDLGALAQYVEAGAALVLDAREPAEHAAGHIPGSISLPYDEAISDPARLEALDSDGRPIVIYCGGGSCEVSLSLAEELFYLGHERVAVYMGGFPEWEAAGHPVAGGSASTERE